MIKLINLILFFLFGIILIGFTSAVKIKTEYCSPYIEKPGLIGILRSITIPIPKLEFKTLTCNQIDFWKWIVNIEEDTNAYRVIGIRLWAIITLSTIFSASIWVGLNRRLKYATKYFTLKRERFSFPKV